MDSRSRTRQGTHDGSASVLPRLRHDRGDESDDRARRLDRDATALRARPGARGRHKEEADAVSRRADDVHGDHQPPKLEKFDLTSIKVCLSGGAPLPVEIKRRFETLSGCKLVEGYGLTETSPLATANPFDGLNKEGSIGLPVPGTSIAIVDKEDPHKLLPQGEDGETCVSGPQVMKGYWRRDEETAATIVDGRLLTGDVGHIDADGYVFIIDRKKNLVLVSGFNVFPRKVEEGIYRHPAVEEVTVIGVPDDYTCEAVKAFVKLKGGAALEAGELKDFLTDKLGRHEMPKFVEFRDELPKPMIGKLSKKELVAKEAAASESASG